MFRIVRARDWEDQSAKVSGGHDRTLALMNSPTCATRPYKCPALNHISRALIVARRLTDADWLWIQEERSVEQFSQSPPPPPNSSVMISSSEDTVGL